MIFKSFAQFALVALGFGSANGCDRHPVSKPDVTVKAGIFYGGQIQNRSDWPFILDATRQTQGFRIEFGQPLAKPAEVHWTMTRVVERGKGRAYSSSDSDGVPATVTVPAGSQRFDQIIPFATRDRPGDWKLAVSVDGKKIWDQTIHVVPKPPATSDD